jgi:hypothetical protein
MTTNILVFYVILSHVYLFNISYLMYFLLNLLFHHYITEVHHDQGRKSLVSPQYYWGSPWLKGIISCFTTILLRYTMTKGDNLFVSPQYYWGSPWPREIISCFTTILLRFTMTMGDNLLFHHNITEVHHDQGR